jgi:predicted tellurium resistance membrane protein TerC
MNALASPEVWIALLTLTILEIVLGVDNIIFISILSGKLPPEMQNRARQLGLALALITRIALLASMSWIVSLTKPLFTLDAMNLHFAPSGRDLILLGGGIFLIAKATHEIHDKLEGGEEHGSEKKAKPSFWGIIFQILLLDVVFSLDSVITAVGMVKELWVMITAVIIAIVIMLFSAGAISDFVNRHPTVKMLALSFLLLIGFTLVMEGFHQEIPKGYIYFAMGFSVLVELLNLRMRKPKTAPVQLHSQFIETEAGAPSVAKPAAKPAAKKKS